MSGNILTPTAVWKDFKLSGEIKAEIIKECAKKGISTTHLRISGRKTADGEVGIYGVLTRKAQLTLAPAIIIVQEFTDGADTTLGKFLAEKGYTVLTVDLAGETEFNVGRAEETEGIDKPYTIYPESLKYAVYDEKAEDKAVIEGDAKATCWYEWARVIRYALEYIKTQPLITKVGILGVGKAATPLWQVLSADCGLSCAAVIGNAGWKGYRGIYKFGETPEPQFNDDALKYLAGIEPQAYAAHVKCPLMLLSATNSPDFDIDRAYDTVSRISQSIYTAVDYSVGGRKTVSAESFDSVVTFFDEFLLKDKPVLADEVTVKATVQDGEIIADVFPDANGLKNISVYFAEGEITPALRSWNKETEHVKGKDGVYTFRYAPYNKSGLVTFFARAEYENGFSVCSVMGCRKFEAVENWKNNGKNNEHRVLFSSRLVNKVNGFYPAKENILPPLGITLNKSEIVKIKNGPMEIAGLSCSDGIITFKINAKKYKPTDNSMLMLDVFAKGGGNFCVKAISDYFGKKTEYIAQVKLFGDLWQNVKIEINNFKTAEGMGLKSYEMVEALEFTADKEFLINNLLWV